MGLVRKTMLLLMEMIKVKFPKNKRLYLDMSQGRILDLSDLIKNLKNRANSFDPEEKKLILRILQKAEEFKKDANDKTHSLYHLCNKKELEEKDPQVNFDLMKEFFKRYP